MEVKQRLEKIRDIPFRNLSVKDKALKKELLGVVDRVLSHGYFILGPEVEELEAQIAAFCQKKYAVGMNSGTDALYLALRSLEIGPGDEVITTPLSWIATVNAIVLCGATPVFVDIEDDLNINADLVEKAITPKTKAILPVHFTGKMCDIVRIKDIAKRHHLYVVEDAAQAFGASIPEGVAGSFSDIGCFSLNPMKILCAYGEAGAVVTDDAKLSERLASLRYGGTVNREDCHWPSLNGRIDSIQAAMVSVNLKYLKDKIKRRQEIANRYTSALKEVVTCPRDDRGCHVYYSYTILVPRRDELKEYLLRNGIASKVQHPILMPYHSAYKGKFAPLIPVAEQLVQQLLCIPNDETLVDEEIDYIIDHIKQFYSAK